MFLAEGQLPRGASYIDQYEDQYNKQRRVISGQSGKRFLFVLNVKILKQKLFQLTT